MIDLVDRQAAIDAVCSACGYDCDKSEFVYDAPQDEQVILCPEHYALTSLPSAQPETDSFCDGCKEYDQEKHFCPRFDRVIKQTVEEMQIIHCKDCKHGELFSDQYLCRKAMFWREGDFYCADAERREDV